MIITTSRTHCVGELEIIETASIELKKRDNVNDALELLWRIRARWIKDDKTAGENDERM